MRTEQGELEARSEAEASPRPATSVTAKTKKQAWMPYIFLVPFAVPFVVFLILPLLYALYTSLFQEQLVGGTVFAGTENYVEAFGDPSFRSGIGRMVLFGVVQVPVMIGLALAFALILDGGVGRIRRFFRLAAFLPYAVPTVVAALLWGYLYGPSFGPFAQMAESAGLATPKFLSDSWMLWSLANILTWEYTGYNMIIMYAALQAVTPDLKEAAAVDGASPWKVARYIKIPLIAPALVLTVVFSIIGTLQLFNEPRIMEAISPTVIQTDYTPNLYAYNLAFTNQEYNYAAAISFVLGAVVFVGSYTFMIITNKRAVR